MMRTAVCLPTFGDFDAATLGRLAREAEDAGWDGCFVWDHVLYDPLGRGVADTTVALTAVALATERVRFGTLVTPLARRRPWKLARELASLDLLSGGRLALGIGNGDDVDFAPVGDPSPARARAGVLDESLTLLRAFLAGGPVTHHGETYDIDAVDLHLAATDIPIWVAGWWPNTRPLRRAAEYDGVVPLWRDADRPTPEDFAQCLAVVAGYRAEGGKDGAYDALVWSRSDSPADPRPREFADAGGTWWVEAFDPRKDDLAIARARIAAGPPAV